ncbi:MAG TPA: AbrB/MazE/SpoVT family DNA-binding domain-containing protein [bacterium]|nr:AbrB/MazE/SpoVT family DNA-binding domain-containing protein [bacterium]
MKNESTISSKGQVTIPAKFRKELGLEPRDKIRFEREGEKLVIRPIRKQDLLDLYQSVPAPEDEKDLHEIRQSVQKAIGEQAAREGR